MGTALSTTRSSEPPQPPDEYSSRSPSQLETPDNKDPVAETTEEPEDDDDLIEKRKKLERHEKLEEFKQELAKKKEARIEAMAALRNTVGTLKSQSKEESDKKRKLMEEKADLQKKLEETLRLLEAPVETGRLLEEKHCLQKRLEESAHLLEEERKAAARASALLKETEGALEEKNALLERLQETARSLERERAEKKQLENRLEESSRGAVEHERIALLEKQLDDTRALLQQETSAKEECLEKNKELEEKAGHAAELEKQVQALKDVANIGKQILSIREKQVNELNLKLKVIEMTGAEYEKEVENIRRLKALYEERARASQAEHRVELERERARVTVASTQLALSRQQVGELQQEKAELEERLKRVDDSLQEAKVEISDLKIELATKGERLYHANSQMAIVNTLFTQVLEGPDMDFDRLATLLEENHDLINDLTAKGKMEEVASVLLEIADREKTAQQEETGTPVGQPPDEPPHNEGVTENLTKVWRVLVELLSHHHEGTVKEGEGAEYVSCYKKVDTPRGPRTVISPSQTYIKLKDLILEKNSLVKEVGRLRSLNGHLEDRLSRQQDRLSLVTEELGNTWAVVSQLRQQHKQLHTQEQILRYELKHKRMMLNELKKQLEICREQWESARQKNVQTEEDWRLLREEFASRKRAAGSAESGYEDEDTASPVSELEDAEVNQQADEDFGAAEMLDEEETHLEDLHRVLGSPREEGDTENTPEEAADTEQVPSGGVDALEEEPDPEEIVLTVEELQELLRIDEQPPKQKEDSACFVLQDESRTSRTGSAQQEPPTVELEEERPPDDTSRSEAAVEPEASAPSTSEDKKSTHEEDKPKRKRTAEEVLAGREARLKRLEEQCKSLFTKMNITSARSDLISTRLEELHEHYGGETSATVDGTAEPSTTEGVPAPPPMPQHLLHALPPIRPSRRPLSPLVAYISRRF